MMLFHLLSLILLTVLLGPIYRILLSGLRRVPGPWLYALSSWRLAYDDLQGCTTRNIHRLHQVYGPVVRLGPDTVSFNSLEALKTIYGAGSRSQRTSFYKLFEPYGRPTMFTMSPVEDHRARKRMLAKPYAKTNIISGWVADAIEVRVWNFMRLLEHQPTTCDVGSILGFFSLDVATAFVYGSKNSTRALTGDEKHTALLDDYKNPFRRQLSWLGVHGGSKVTTWFLGGLVSIPSSSRNEQAFSRIRTFAREAYERASNQLKGEDSAEELSLLAQLQSGSTKSQPPPLQDIDIVSECADHLLAGIETTRNLLLFLIWALSVSRNQHCQKKLREELKGLNGSHLNERGLSTVEAADKLPYLNAVLKEALRLYAPLPASQPRFFDHETIINGYAIPANTTVSMSPYCLHQSAEPFVKPDEFRPERWLEEGTPEMQKWWWPFSSGGRMCTGMHLAMAEISTLVAAIYQQYTTTVPSDLQDVSPAISSRFEIFWDERYQHYKEDSCIIELHKV